MSTTEEDTPKLADETVDNGDATADAASSKRKREETETENNTTEAVNETDLAKKAKVESEANGAAENNGNSAAYPTLAVDPAVAGGQELLVLEIAQDKVGQIIGSKGMIIQEIQTRSGARAYVNQDFPDGVNRQVNITGLPQQVKMAAELINLIITQGPTAIHVNSMAGGPVVTQMVECTQAQVGKIIGTGGATIKELQSKSGARIQIDQDFPPEVPRKINITGTQAAVTLGVQVHYRRYFHYSQIIVLVF